MVVKTSRVSLCLREFVSAKALRHKERASERISHRGCLSRLKIPGFPINLKTHFVLPGELPLPKKDELLLKFDAIADILVFDQFIFFIRHDRNADLHEEAALNPHVTTLLALRSVSHFRGGRFCFGWQMW